MIKKIVYRLTVWATMPIAEDDTDPDDDGCYTLETATSSTFKRDIEKSARACLKRMEQDCDVELMDFSVEEE